MTAYELFRRAHIHHSGQFLSKIWKCKVKDIDPKADTERSFEVDVEEYCVKWANDKGFELEYNPAADKTTSKVTDLGKIILQAGYWLCHYDGHTGAWYCWWYGSRSEARTAYKKRYMRYYRHVMWFCI